MRLWTLPVLALLAVTAFALNQSSPMQEGREPAWYVGGVAGVIALVLLPFQPAMVSRFVQPSRTWRRVHPWLGGAVLVLIGIHVGALWINSPEDINDALLLRAPTPFFAWGVAALAAFLVAAILVTLRSIPSQWRIVMHFVLATVGAVAAAVHAWMILSTMEPVSKAAICIAILVSSALPLRTVYRRLTSGTKGLGRSSMR